MSAPLHHIFVTQTFPPESGGMARRHGALVADYGEPMNVSTVAHADASAVDAASHFAIHRQEFSAQRAKLFANEIQWGRSLARRCATGIDMLHCGEIRPVGYAVWWAHKRTGVPYVIYVNGGDLLHERRKTSLHWTKRMSAYRLFSDAAGIVANSDWTAQLARDLMRDINVATPPPVASIHLGTDPTQFNPGRATGGFRTRLAIPDASRVMLTVARLVPRKGQDVAIRALALVRDELPDLHYAIVGYGDDEQRLRSLAATLGVADRVHFTGQLPDAELADAYASSDLYVGLSRMYNNVTSRDSGFRSSRRQRAGCVRSPVTLAESGVLCVIMRLA